MDVKGLYRYLLIIPILIILGWLMWYFREIVAYILAASVLSLLGRPIVSLLKKITFRKKEIPDGICAAISLGLIVGVFALVLSFVIPLLAYQARSLSQIDAHQIYQGLAKPMEQIEALAFRYHLTDTKGGIVAQLQEKLSSLFNITRVTDTINTLLGFAGNLFFALFAILFISFFFLKESKLFYSMIMAPVPDDYTQRVHRVIVHSRELLSRYFVAVLTDMTVFALLITIGLYIAGVPNALLIGVIAGLLNIVPYIGPLIAGLIGMVFTIGGHLQDDFYLITAPLLLRVFIVFVIVKIIDDVLVQPYIFSNSVNAHPLEIFLVIIIAEHVAGIMGMVLAVPIYTLFRVIAKEFLSEFKVVRTITHDM